MSIGNRQEKSSTAYALRYEYLKWQYAHRDNVPHRKMFTNIVKYSKPEDPLCSSLECVKLNWKKIAKTTMGTCTSWTRLLCDLEAVNEGFKRHLYNWGPRTMTTLCSYGTQLILWTKDLTVVLYCDHQAEVSRQKMVRGHETLIFKIRFYKEKIQQLRESYSLSFFQQSNFFLDLMILFCYFAVLFVHLHRFCRVMTRRQWL